MTETTQATDPNKTNDYASLLTVLGLVLIVVYAKGGYDWSDLIIALLSFWFSAVTLLKTYKTRDFFERVVLGLTLILSFKILISCGIAIKEDCYGFFASLSKFTSIQ